MTDFFELEKRCKKLQQKKLLKIFIPVILILLGIAIAFYYLNQPKPKKHKHIQKPQHKKPKPIQKPIKQTPIKETKPKQQKPAKKPIKQPAPILSIDIDFNNVKNITQPKQQKPAKKPIKQTPIKETKPIKTETITFSKALTLAKSYYENGDYQTSMKWCKIASKIDNTNEQIWKLYALNLEKLGQKQKAIKVLKTYLQYRDSIELKYILQRLEK